MIQRMWSVNLALCLCISSNSVAHALQEQPVYQEGAAWTNEYLYSDPGYRWKGGPFDGKNIVAAVCVAFAFILSDAAFDSLPARMYGAGDFTFADIPEADKTFAEGVPEGGLAWKMTKAGTLTVLEGVENIGPNAFNACTGLKFLSLPASIGEVGEAVFMQCTALEKVVFAPGDKQVRMGGNLFTGCYRLMGVTLPKRIDCISEGMFQNCLMLMGVEIPQGVESIGANAFSSRSACTTVLIPDSVTSVGIAACIASFYRRRKQESAGQGKV